MDGTPSTWPRTSRVTLPTGASLVVDLYGSAGPAVLLLHGIPGWRGTFRAVAERLGRSCRVFVPDLLGFGGSDPTGPRAHAREHATAVAQLVDALNLDVVHVVGFDFGGPIAVLAAGASPTRIRSLAVAATNLFPDTSVPLPLRLATVPALGALVFRLLFGRIGLSLLWRGAVADRRAFPFRRYREALRSRRGIVSTRSIFLASMRDLAGLYGEIERVARGLALPALVLWGDRDPFFAVSVGARTADALGASLRVLPGCGHFVPEERPAEVAAAVLGLVERSDP